MAQILTAATDNSDLSDVFAIDPEKGATLQIDGTWDTATLTLEGSVDGTTWTTREAYTDDVCKRVDSGPDTQWRLILSSVGGSTSLNAWVS